MIYAHGFWCKNLFCCWAFNSWQNWCISDLRISYDVIWLTKRPNEWTQRFTGRDSFALSKWSILPSWIAYKTISNIILDFHDMLLKFNPLRSWSFVLLKHIWNHISQFFWIYFTKSIFIVLESLPMKPRILISIAFILIW